MVVEWIKCQENQWCNLINLNLSHPHFTGQSGIYIIWHGGQNPRTVYVGQGSISDRLAVHRTEPNIVQYNPFGLFVTWARVDSTYRDGIERFLANNLRPLEGIAHPSVNPIDVNLPW